MFQLERSLIILRFHAHAERYTRGCVAVNDPALVDSPTEAKWSSDVLMVYKLNNACYSFPFLTSFLKNKELLNFIELLILSFIINGNCVTSKIH